MRSAAVVRFTTAWWARCLPNSCSIRGSSGLVDGVANRCDGHQLGYPRGPVAVADEVVTFEQVEHRPEPLGVRAVVSPCEAEPERGAHGLQEVSKFLDLQLADPVPYFL